MEVTYSTNKLKKLFKQQKEAIRKWGPDAGQKIGQRQKEMEAALSLKILGKLPSLHLHPLEGNREGQYAITVLGLLRIIFKPNHSPTPKLEDGGVDLSKVTQIKVLEVKDYHDKKNER